MKRLLVLLAAMAMAVGAQAFTFSTVLADGQTIYLTVSGTAEVKVVPPTASGWSGYTTPVGRLDIPATLVHEGTTYSVTAIDHSAFLQCYGLTAVSIPGSVQSIGRRAFAEDTMLASVTIGEGVQRIEMMAFFMCSSLDTITLPTTLTRLAVSAFEGTAYYNNAANWGEHNMLTLGGWLLRGGSLLDGHVVVPEGIVGLANNAFYYCQSIAKVTLPTTVQYLGEGAFKACSSLDTVEVLAMVPPALYDDCFEDVPAPLTVVVPCGTVAVYGAADVWRDCNIVEASCGGDEPWAPVNPMPQPLPDPLPQLGIGDLPSVLSVSVSVLADGLRLSHADGLPVEVIDGMGRRVMALSAAASEQHVPLSAPGLYVVHFPSLGAAMKVIYSK